MRNVLGISFSDDLWENIHLLKDNGLIPYYFHEIYGYNAALMGANRGPYPYLDTYVQGLKMITDQGDSVTDWIIYLEKHAREIDLLIMIGAYPINLEYAYVYKSNNPSGKIYLQLDMNSEFGEYVFRTYPDMVSLGDICDVIATSGRRTQRWLNARLPWDVEYMPNCFFSKLFPDAPPVYGDKKNWIFTAARLGIWAKNTEMLLNAFAGIAELLPSWELHLAGNMDEEFIPWWNEFTKNHSDIMSRIVWHGPIQDKNELISLYYSSKIFALPSRMEGGTPNVVAEALRSGCVIATTQFDEYDDAIYGGKCGFAVRIDDVSDYAIKLYELCRKDDMEQMSEAAYEYALANYDYTRNVRRLHGLVFGEF